MATRIAFLDFETTGLNASDGDRPTEIGFVVLEGHEVVEKFATLVNPGRRISRRASAVSGITDEMVQRAPSMASGFKDLRAKTHGIPIVAHNASFERQFLEKEFKQLRWRFTNQLICSCLIAKRIVRSAGNHRLGTLVDHFKLTFDGDAHRALPDAYMTAMLWIEFEKLLQSSYRIPQVPIELMSRLQSIPIQQSHDFLTHYAERELKKSRNTQSGAPKRKCKPTPRTRAVPTRAASTGSAVKATYKHAKPIRFDLLPENMLSKKTARTSSGPQENAADASGSNAERPISSDILPETSVKAARVGALEGNIQRLSREKRQQPKNARCIHCNHRDFETISANFPWLRCKNCNLFTPKPCRGK